MIQRIFMQYDRVAGVFSDPFVCPTDEEAKRIYRSLLEAKTGNVYNVFASDKELYYVASYDTQTGVVECPEKPVFLLKAVTEYNG